MKIEYESWNRNRIQHNFSFAEILINGRRIKALFDLMNSIAIFDETVFK